jgi:RNA polymerase sigma-70 factor (ECF subfamily)
MLNRKAVSHELAEKGSWTEVAEQPGLAEVYRENVQYVWRCLRHLGVRTAELEDVTHDVFIVVGRKLSSFEGRSSLRTWIYGICLRTASDYRARAVHRREVLGVEQPARAKPAEQGRRLEEEQLREKLVRLLDGLPEEQREVFVLYEVEELSMKEIAEVARCPLQTAYSRLHAARRALREALVAEGVGAHG